jgi:hypothetical protein
LAKLLREAALDCADVRLQLADAPHLFMQAVDQHRRQTLLRLLKCRRQSFHQSLMALGQDDAEFVE